MHRSKTLPTLLVWLFLSSLAMVAAFAPGEQVLSFPFTCFRRPTTGRATSSFTERHRNNKDHKERVDIPLWASLPEDCDKDGKSSDAEETRTGVLVLFTVPFAWGTFEPAVRYVYEVQPNVPPFLFQFVYYFVAVISLAVFTTTSTMIPAFHSTPPIETITDPTKPELPPSSNTTTSWLKGGLELGTYLFLGNAMQVVGLKTVPSDRAAFLLQLTTVFVPLMQSIAAKDLSILPLRTWLACFIALTGVACIGLDGGSSTKESVVSIPGIEDLSFTPGDFFIVLAALFYTFHCLRLELYAKCTPALQLALAKASTEMAWCGVVVLGSLIAAINADSLIHDSLGDMAISSGQNVLQYVESFQQTLRDPTVSYDTWIVLGGATTWIGLVTVGYTIAAQSYGQARVPPATANLIYTIQPLFTALIAYVTLGETLGLPGYVGAILIAAAVIMVTRGTG